MPFYYINSRILNVLVTLDSYAFLFPFHRLLAFSQQLPHPE